MKRSLVPVFVIACFAIAAHSDLPLPSFEVASIRLTDPNMHGGNIEDHPGSLIMRGVTLRVCIQWAYDVPTSMISGPAWLGDTRFDIAAKAGDAAGTDRLRVMLRALLAERFALKAHHELKQLTVYSMVVGPHGPRFHEAGPKDESRFLESTGDGPNRFREDKTGLIGERVSMADLAAQLAQPLQCPVIDKTGLKGRYDIRIDISSFVNTETEGKQTPDPMDLVFTAFPSQLGLNFEQGKDTVDFLVIDSANKVPAGN